MTTDSKALIKFTPMSLDTLDEQERSISFGQNSNFFQWKDGRNVVRVLPGLNGMQPFVQFWKHFVKGAEGGKAFGGPCPLKMAKLPCLVCMVNARLSRGSEVDRKLADDQGARGRIACSLIDRAAPDAGPQLAEIGSSIYGQVKDFMRMTGDDPTHPFDGVDLNVEKKGSGLNTEYKVIAARKSSPLHPDQRQVAEWLEAAPDLGVVVMLPTEEQQAERLAGTVIGHLLASAGKGPGTVEVVGRADVQRTRTQPSATVKQARTVVAEDDDLGF